MNIVEKYLDLFHDVKLGFNWFTVNLVVVSVLTVFTEILFLNYFRYRQGYIVAYCYLLWTLVTWYYLMHGRIKATVRGLLENNR